MASQNHIFENTNNPAKSLTLSIETLSSSLIYQIFGFLPLNDIGICSSVCKNWKKVSDKYFKNLRSIFITTPKDVTMYCAIAPLSDIQNFSLLDHGSIHLTDILGLLNEIKPTVKSLDINYTTHEPEDISLIFLALTKAFPNTQTFKYFGRTISENDIAILKGFQNLREFYLLEDCYIEGKYFNQLPPLEILVIHSHLIRYEYVKDLLKASCKQLKKITLDMEEYEEEDIADLVEILKESTLQSVDFRYCNNLKNEHLTLLSGQTLLRKLSLRKTFYVTEDGYSKFFENKFTKLEKLQLAMNNGVDSRALVNIAKGCENLKELDITWCELIDDKGLYEIFLRCWKLQTISIVGLKKATDKAFPVIKEYYERKGKVKVPIWNNNEIDIIREELKAIKEEKFGEYTNFSFYKNLKFIDATKCDFIPDDVYLLLLLINPNIEAMNYYEEKVVFPVFGQEINYDD